jgi:hypothetical protein
MNRLPVLMFLPPLFLIVGLLGILQSVSAQQRPGAPGGGVGEMARGADAFEDFLLWRHECVDCSATLTYGSERALQLDRNNRPHLVYGGNRLYHVWYDGVAWQSQVVDPAPGVGGVDAAE